MSSDPRIVNNLEMNKVIFVESGFGCDPHGQDSTKAAIRACRNAIEFNSLPALDDLIPGGRQNMILRIKIGVPDPERVDINELISVFPYGKLMLPEVVDGGLRANSFIELSELGDKNDDMIIAVAAISVGY